MLIESPEALRAWLSKEMAPICDAEPAALAKYVLALLRKDKPEKELMEFCIEQLDVFLQSKAREFVERLFSVIKDRSYLPVQTAVATNASHKAGSAPQEERKKDIDERREFREKDKEEERRKTANQTEREREQRKPREEKEVEKKAPVVEQPVAPQQQQQKPIRKRISPPPAAPREEPRRDHSAPRFERRRSRSPRDRRLDRGDRATDRRNPPVQPPRGSHRQGERYKSERVEKVERKRSRSPYERPRREKSSEGERKKKRCRDYDEKGYCMKGDQCVYDHGPDPVVVDDIALEKMVSNGGKAATAVVPAIAPNFSVPPPGYTPLNPPPPGVDNVYMANSTGAPAVVISEGYNPEAPALSAPSIPPAQTVVQAASLDFSVPPPPLPPYTASPAWHPNTYAPAASVLVHPATVPYDPTQPSTTVPPVQVVQQPPVSLNSGAPRRGRGGMMGGAGRFGQRGGAGTDSRTLQVRKIPAEMNNITKLNEHFAQFGQIVNMQVCYEGDPEAALITYATRQEATAAYKSTAPILNNRFIKVFWHSSDGQTGANNQNAHMTGITSGSAVTFNARGSLTKTVHIGNVQRQTGGQNPLSQKQVAVSSYGTTQEANAAPLRQTSQPSATDREKYIEVRRKRKQDKENKMRMLDLHRRKSDLVTKQIDQQKLIIQKIQQATDSGKKKQLFKLYKTVDDSIKTLKADLEELSAKLLSMNKECADDKKLTVEAKGAVGDAGVDSVGVSGRLPKRSRLVSDDGHHSDTMAPVKKNRHIDSTQALDKRPSKVAVSGFPVDAGNDVILHMENFGELSDMYYTDGGPGKPVIAYFTYKKRRDAEQAVELGSDFAGCPLKVEWATKQGGEDNGVVPDEKRNPSERVTPAALLASCPLDESDEEVID